MTAQWILLVLEDGQLPDECICYSIKLARRLECSISVLMLGKHSGEEEDSDMSVSLASVLDIIRSEGIDAEGDVVCGDKASAFLKHLARTPTLSAIVWGCREPIGKEGLKHKGDNWFGKVKSSVQCPVVRPEIKNKYKDPGKNLKKKSGGLQ